MQWLYEMPCATWCDLHYLKNVKNSHGGVLLLVILQAKACNFTTTNTPCLVLSMFFKLYKLYQVAKSISYYFGIITFTEWPRVYVKHISLLRIFILSILESVFLSMKIID